MKTNRKMVKQWLLESIELDGYEMNPKTNNDKILCAFNVARQEVGPIAQRDGNQKMIEYWLSGLCSVINPPYLYHDIMELAVKWNSIPADYTEKQADKIWQNWFNYLACQFMQMVYKAQKEQSKL